jgi:hypothetical protein
MGDNRYERRQKLVSVLRVLFSNDRMRNSIPFVVFLLLSFNTIVWFHRGLPIGYGDAGLMQFFYHPGYLLQMETRAWNSVQYFGSYNPQGRALLPVILFFDILSHLGIPLYMRQLLYYLLIEFFSMVAMYLFVSSFMSEMRRKSLVAFVAAIFYVFNPLTLITYWYFGNFGLATLAFAPCLLYAIQRTRRSLIIVQSFAIGMILCIFSIVWSNPAFSIPVVFLGAVLWVFNFIDDIRNYTHHFWHATKSILGITNAFVLNSWYLVPLVFGTSFYYRSAVKQTSFGSANVLSNAANDVNAHSMVIDGFQPFARDSAIWAYKWPSWHFAYYDAPLRLIGIVILIVTLVGFLGDLHSKKALLLKVLAVIGLVLELGAAPPFGEIFKLGFNIMPYAQAFRVPFNVFPPVLLIPVSVIFAIGFVRLLEIRRFVYQTAVYSLLPLIFGIYMFPYWTGSVINSPVMIRGLSISSTVKVPSAYGKVRQFLAMHHYSGCVLALPLRPQTYVTERWRFGYDGPDLTWLLLEHNVLSDLANGQFPATKLLQNAEKKGIPAIVSAAEALSCRYILVQSDVRTVYGAYSGIELMDPKSINAQLIQMGVPKVFGSQALSVYALPSAKVSPIIGVSYASKAKAASSVNNLDSINNLRILNSNSDGFTFAVRPKYANFTITYATNFDRLWRLIPLSQSNNISRITHRMVYGYANGWRVQLRNFVQSKTLMFRIYFGPDGYQTLGWQLTLMAIGLSVVGSLVYVLRAWRPMAKN